MSWHDDRWNEGGTVRLKVFLLFLVLTMLLLLLPASSRSCQFVIEPERSYAEFRLTSAEGAKVEGRFSGISGEFLYDGGRPRINTFRIRIDARPSTVIPVAYGRLAQEPDFFDTDRHPVIAFDSEWYCDSLDRGVVKGTLAIRGVKQEISLELEKKGESAAPGGGEHLSLAARGEIDPRGFGITNRALSGDAMMELNIRMEGVRR